MAPIRSSLARTVSKLLGISKNTDLSLRGATQSTRFFASTFSSSGGTKITDGADILHVFTSDDTLTFDGPYDLSLIHI